MVVDPKILDALGDAVRALAVDAPHPTPTGAIAALSAIAKPGVRLRIDVAASQRIGAPLVSVENAGVGDLLAPLTARQRAVAELILEGCTNREIAARLGISVATVKDHVHAILSRLELSSRAALIVRALG